MRLSGPNKETGDALRRRFERNPLFHGGIFSATAFARAYGRLQIGNNQRSLGMKYLDEFRDGQKPAC